METTLVSLARTLLEVTAKWWPEEDEDSHFNHKAFIEDPSDELLGAAADAGFELVGCGNFTAVFSHPTARDVVFKLNAGTLDRMREYHLWLMQQSHPNLPRVHHVETLGEGTCAVAERLSVAPGYSFCGEENARNEAARKSVLTRVDGVIKNAGFCCDDTHPGNYMMRGNVWVVNDPHSNHNSYGEYT